MSETNMNPLLVTQGHAGFKVVATDQGSGGPPPQVSIINGSAAGQPSSIIHQANLPDMIE